MIIQQESIIFNDKMERMGTFTRAYYVDFDDINKTITVNGVNNEIKPLSGYIFLKGIKNMYGNYERIKEILLDFKKNGVKALLSAHAEGWLDVFAGKTVAKIYKKGKFGRTAFYKEIFE